MKEIFNRRSIRKFTDQPVESEKIDKLLRAAMQAPSAMNRQPWEFIVIKDKDMLKKLSECSPYAKPVLSSSVTFTLLCNDNEMKIPIGWEEDMAAAAQNMLLEAVHLDLGAVWLGVAVSKDATENVRALLKLPNHVKPFALISVGYPDEQKNEFKDRYNEDRIHYEKW